MQRRLKLLALVLAGVLLATVPSSSSLSVEPPSVSQTRLERTRDQELGFVADQHLLRRREQYDGELRAFERLGPETRQPFLGREQAWDTPWGVAEAAQQVDLSRISPVVQIAAFQDKMALGPGSGTLIHPSGLILTNSHVVRKGPGGCGVAVQGDLGSLFVVLVTEAGKEGQPPVPKFTAALVAEDPQLDVALLRIDQQVEGLKDLKELKEAVAQDKLRTVPLPSGLTLPHWNLWDSRVLKEESRVLAWGYPAEDIPQEQLPRLELSRGPIFTLKPPEGPQHLFIDKLFTIGGISGGPVIDPKTGLIVGVVCGKGIPTKPAKPAEELTKAVLINEIQELLEKSPQRINRYPVADFTWSPLNPKVGDVVTFDASASFDFDGSIAQYEWDFNSDGKPDASGVKMSFKVPSPEDVSVTLTVKDNEGAPNSQTKRVILQREQTCKARIGEREYDSIGEAIKEAEPGDTIMISEGQCQEDLLITGKQNLTLKGRKGREKTTLFGSGTAPAIAIQDSQGIVIEGLTIRDGLVGLLVQNSSDVVIRQNAVMQNLGRGISLMDSSGVKIEQNVIEANGEEGLQVRGAQPGEMVEVRANEIRANEEGGVLVRGNVKQDYTLRVRLVDNEIGENQIVGVAITHFAAAEISGGRTTETKRDAKEQFGNGLEIDSGFQAASISNITIADNAAAGIEVKGVSKGVTVTDSAISGNGSTISGEEPLGDLIVGGGLIIGGSAQVSVINSTVSDNKWYGLRVGDSATVSLISSPVSRNRNGLEMEDSATVTLTDSQLSSNVFGLVVDDSARMSLINSQISGNGGDGLFARESAIVSLTNSTVSGNGQEGLWVGGSAWLNLSNVQLSGNRSSGLAIAMSAIVEIRDAWISDNGNCGISHISSAKVEGRNNWIWYNAEDLCNFSPPEGFRRPKEEPPRTLLDEITICPKGCQFAEVAPAVWAMRPGGVMHIRPGTYGGGVVIVKNLTVEGAGAAHTVLTGSSWDGILIAGDAHVRLQGLRLSGNQLLAGLVVYDSAQVSLINSQFLGNDVYGLFVWGSGQVSLINSLVSDNDTGFIVYGSATVILTNSQFSGNGDDGLDVRGSSTVSLIDSQVSGNGDNGLLVGHLARVNVQGSTIEGNGTNPNCQNERICSGIYVWDKSRVTIINSNILNNADWGVSAWWKQCGYSDDGYTGKIVFEGEKNVIEGNNTSGNQNGMGNPGNHPWNRPEVPDGQVCLP